MLKHVIRLGYMPDADQGIPLPEYKSAGAAGMDIRANLKPDLRPQGILILPNQTRRVGTGIMLAIPKGFEGQIRPRSGLALKHFVTVLNSPGTIDSDFRGEIEVLMINHGNNVFKINHGDRIAQIVFQKIAQIEIKTVDHLPRTDRGTGGFGSTGE